MSITFAIFLLLRNPGNITRKVAFVQSRLTRMLHMQEQNLISDKAESRRVHIFSVSVALVKWQNDLILSPSMLYAFRFEQHFARRSGMTHAKPKICIHDNLLS
jgi:succinylglutamate desuccinylase